MDIAFTYASAAFALAALASAALIRLYIFSSGKGFERLVPCVQTWSLVAQERKEQKVKKVKK